MTKYIIVCPKNGKAVQNWSFADRKHIIYCSSPEWAMKWDEEDSAKRRMEFLKANFPGQELTVLRVTFNTTVTIG
jgi:hypothetical protein